MIFESSWTSSGSDQETVNSQGNQMADLRLAMALMALLSVASFLGVRRLCAKAGPRVLDALAAVLVLIIGVYIRFVWGQLWIVEWIPLPSVVILEIGRAHV